jgi:hypothetical protein
LYKNDNTRNSRAEALVWSVEEKLNKTDRAEFQIWFENKKFKNVIYEMENNKVFGLDGSLF